MAAPVLGSIGRCPTRNKVPPGATPFAIRALDRKNGTATLEGPDGELTTIAVRNPQHFDVAQVGDLVEITYTEAVAIAVDKKD